MVSRGKRLHLSEIQEQDEVQREVEVLIIPVCVEVLSGANALRMGLCVGTLADGVLTFKAYASS